MTERTYKSHVNADGLRQTYGSGEAQVGRAGEVADGIWNTFTCPIIHDELRAFDDGTDPTTVLDFHARIPSGAYIGKCTLYVEESFVSAGTAGTLDIGLALASDMEYALTHTGVSDAAIDSAIAEAALVAGASITCDGADVETILPSVSGGYLVTAEAGVENFSTSGEARLEIKWRMPIDDSDT
jgi:hypothetical protein